jgi:hypothetical protein
MCKAIVVVDQQTRIQQRSSNDSGSVKRMKPFSHVLNDQNPRSIVDLRNAVAKTTIHWAMATVTASPPIASIRFRLSSR